jgi:hypothetical protein
VGPNHKAKGLKGRPAGPTPRPTGQTLSRFRLGLRSIIHTSVHKSILCLRVDGYWEEWPVGHVDGHPAIHHLQIKSIKSVEAPLYLDIRILTVEFTHTTLFLYFSSYKSPGLVVEAQAKPCRESRVESSLCSSFESSLEDQRALVSLPFFIDFEL